MNNIGIIKNNLYEIFWKNKEGFEENEVISKLKKILQIQKTDVVFDSNYKKLMLLIQTRYQNERI
jgi:hypothetical protein